MVRTLLTLIVGVALRVRGHRVPLAEAAGVVALIVGLVQWQGGFAGWLAVGAAALVKSLEWESKAGSG